MAEKKLTLKVVCTRLPGVEFKDCASESAPLRKPVYLGIQSGKDVIGQVPADRRQVTFYPEFDVARLKDGSPNFLGPFAQGKPDSRFFYLSWGVRDSHGNFEMFRRLKIPLGRITWREIDRSARTGAPIAVRLTLTDKKGGPLCGTVPDGHIAW